LAAFTRREENTVTVVDLQSGDPRLVVDPGMEVVCLGVTGSTVVVAGKEKIVTWDLPARNHALDARVDINDSIRTIMFDPSQESILPSAISPDLSLFVIDGYTAGSHSKNLGIYDVSTGACLAFTALSESLESLRITPDGREVWAVDDDSSAHGWKIIEDRESGITKLEPLETTMSPPGVFPW